MAKKEINENYVLVVDDNIDNFIYFEWLLKSKKIKNFYAKDGKTAIEIFEKNKDVISLVLLDIGLPDIMGYEVAQEILKIKNVKIIAQSAYAYDEDIKKAYDSGCVDYLTKPISSEKIKKILDKYFFNQ